MFRVAIIFFLHALHTLFEYPVDGTIVNISQPSSPADAVFFVRAKLLVLLILPQHTLSYIRHPLIGGGDVVERPSTSGGCSS